MDGGLAVRTGLLMMVVGLAGCGEQRVAGGNTSETPNTVTGFLLDTTGKARVGDTVILRPARWTSDDLPPAGRAANVLTTVTDSSGAWTLEGMASGAWVVECRGGSVGRLYAAVTVGSENPLVSMGRDTVHAKSSVSGSFEPGTWPAGARGRVWIYGTDLFADIDSTGSFELREVPTGPMRLVAELVTDSAKARAEDAFELRPREPLPPRVLRPSGFLEEDYDLWPHRKAGVLRFSGIGGFALQSTLARVPVLVRLRGEPVSPDDRTGSSLRFEDGGGNKLPYEIERWDPVRREADVWVLLREARKLSDAHGIIVYWGLPEVPDWSDGTAVFDTADGWVGVWHFRGGDPLRDVTANRLHLSGTGWESAQGLIADGIRLRPDALLSMPAGRLATQGGVNFSAWVRPDSVGPDGLVGRLVLPGTDSAAWTLRMGSDSTGALRAGFQTRIHGATRFPTALTMPFARGTWTHLAGILTPSGSSSRIRILVDSVMRTETKFDSVRIDPVRAVFQTGGGWSGQLDELRLRRQGPHPDGIRLEWGTQRIEASVVWWGN